MKALSTFAAAFFRLFAFLVLAALVVFPAYKGIWLGYVPVLCGAVVAWWTWRRSAPEATSARVRIEPERHFPFLLGLVLAQAAIQALLLLLFRPAPWYDGRFVCDEARALLATGHMSPLTYYPPAQTWWYAGFFRFFGASPLVAQLSQVPLSAAVTLIFFALARRVLSLPRARAATCVVAFYPSFLGYVLVTPYYHYLYTAATLAMCVWLLRAEEEASATAPAAVAGFFAGWGALSKAVQLVAPLQALLFWLLAEGRRRPARTALLLAAFVLGMAVVVGPWTLRNWRVFGEPVPVCTSGGLVLYSANNEDSNGLYSDLPDVVQVAGPREMLAYSRRCSQQARAFIAGHPRRFAKLAALKFLHTWGNESAFTDLVNWRGRSVPRVEDALSFVFLTGWSAVVWFWALAAGRALRARLEPGAWELLAAVLVLSNAAIYVVFEGGDRHHLPFVPLIVLVAADVACRAARALRETAPAG